MAPSLVERRPKGGGTLSLSSYSAVTVLFVVAALVLLIVGFSGAGGTSAIQQAAIFAAAAVCGILARIAQAGWQHVKLMDALERLSQR